eukprot:Skav222198  [mRNA]  locus=scaffold1745:80173:80991:- [translate_table: standard]
MQAESGRFPPKCPFCLRKLSLAEVYKNLTAAEKSTWLRYHDRWRELREFGRADADLEEIVALQELGCRRCPSCGTWIQKQSAGWVTGCDKMTCRCGGRFCFQCGSVDATCSCNLGHDFLEKELVLANYSLLDLPWPLSLLLEDVPDIDSSISSVSVSRDLVQGFQGPQVQDEDEEDEEQDEDEDIYWATARQEAHKEEDQGPSPSGTAAQGHLASHMLSQCPRDPPIHIHPHSQCLKPGKGGKGSKKIGKDWKRGKGMPSLIFLMIYKINQQ